jgi:hypothetical protein
LHFYPPCLDAYGFLADVTIFPNARTLKKSASDADSLADISVESGLHLTK